MKMIKKLPVLALTCTILVGTDVSAQSYSDQALASKIERLERDMNMLQREFFRGNRPVPGENNSINLTKPQDGASLGVRLTALEEQLRSLNGRIEETEHKQLQLSEQYNQLVEQIGYLQRSGGASASSTSLAPVPSTPPQPFTSPFPESKETNSDSAQAQYDNAFELLKQAKYSEAQTALKNFLDTNEDDPLASSGYYWLGEAYYMEKDYEQAAIQFLRGYKKFPKGEKAPDSLLKLAIVLGNLNKSKEACTSLGKLNDEFKTISNAIRRRAQEESERLNCT